MCDSRLIKIIVDDYRMILCEESEFNLLSESNVQYLIRKAFLYNDFMSKSFLCLIVRVPYTIRCFCEKKPKIFYKKIEQIAEGNDWKKNRFLAFYLYNKRATRYCATTVIAI